MSWVSNSKFEGTNRWAVADNYVRSLASDPSFETSNAKILKIFSPESKVGQGGQIRQRINELVCRELLGKFDDLMIEHIKNESDQFNDEYWHRQLNVAPMNPASKEIPAIYGDIKAKIITKLTFELLSAVRL